MVQRVKSIKRSLMLKGKEERSGRRRAEGKDCGTVIDFVDDFGMYQGWAKKRMRYYKKIGIEDIDIME